MAEFSGSYRLSWFGEACGCCHRVAPTLQYCGRCRHVRYCSRDCQLKHFAEHKELCVAIGNAKDKFVIDPTISQDDNVQRLQKWLAKNLSGRHATPAERNIVTWQPACAICFKRAYQLPKGKMHKSCKKCKSFFACSDEHWRELDASGVHSQEICAALSVSYASDQILEVEGPTFNVCEGYSAPESVAELKIENWNDWIEWRGLRDLPVEKIMAGSHNYSFVLTVDWALKQSNVDLSGKVLLHLIGADFNEVAVAGCFEELLHLNPGIKTLQIAMVGPDIPFQFHGQCVDLNVCADCESKGKHVEQRLYESASLQDSNSSHCLQQWNPRVSWELEKCFEESKDEASPMVTDMLQYA
jgi:splicing suppressor protein 51